MFAQCFLSCRKTVRYRTVLVEEVVATTVAVTVVVTVEVALTVAVTVVVALMVSVSVTMSAVAVSVTMAAVAVWVTIAAVADHKDEDVGEQGDEQDQWQDQPDRGAEGRSWETPGALLVAPGDKVVGDVDHLPAERCSAFLLPTDVCLGGVKLAGRKDVSCQEVSWSPRGCGRGG